MHVNDNVNRYI